MSPLLANIYLHTLDKYMASTSLDMSYHKRRMEKTQGKANFLYVRYADDFVVLCNGTKAQAHTMKEELQAVLRQMGLELSEEQTKVTHITAGFDFLGYRITRRLGRKGKMAPKVLIPKKAIKKFKNQISGVIPPLCPSNTCRREHWGFLRPIGDPSIISRRASLHPATRGGTHGSG